MLNACAVWMVMAQSQSERVLEKGILFSMIWCVGE